jgi:hypothetical protein
MPDWVAAARCGRRGRSLSEFRPTQLRCSVFGGFSSYGTCGVGGTHQGCLLPVGDSGAGCVVGRLQGSGHDKVGSNGSGAEHRAPASGQWSSRIFSRGVAMKWVNLGFVSVFFYILVQLRSIYRGFRLIVSCMCRALSQSFPIRLGFDILSSFVEMFVGGVFHLDGDSARCRRRLALGCS